MTAVPTSAAPTRAVPTRAVPFSAVVSEHGPTILRYCRSMMPSAEAEDIWSETFLAALRAYPDLDPATNVAAWLTTIARHKTIDRIRVRDREQPISAERDDRPSTDPAYEPPDGRLAEALADLSDRQRIAVVYHHVSGYPFAEVAEILGTSPAAARRSAADGMAKLRAAYGTKEVDTEERT